jgi:ribosomal protein S18 acetylase RimI-like enzyme
VIGALVSPPTAARIAQSLTESARRRYRAVPLGRFLGFFHPTSPLPHANYAVPEDDAVDAADVQRVVDAFRDRKLVPRVEVVLEAHPGACRALERAGFRLDEDMLLLARAAQEDAGAAENELPSVIEAPVGADARALLARALRLQHAVFGAPPPADGDVDAAVRGIGDGAFAVAEDAGAVIAFGCLLASGAGAAEIAGLATDPAYRRRGHAGSAVRALAAIAARRGHGHVYLSAANEGAARLYERLGFRGIGRARAYRAPEAAR